MAIYHLTCKVVQRSKGRSSVAAAAYRAGRRLRDLRQGRSFDYSLRQDVVHREMIGWSGSRESLWNAAEGAEKQGNACTGREYEVALPRELSLEERVCLAHRLGKWLYQEHQCAVDICLHDAGGGNPHAHLLTSTRQVAEDGKSLTGKCAREWSDSRRKKHGLTGRKSELLRARNKWESLVNSALLKAGSSAQVDHRSLEAQGIDRIPGTHLGPARWRAMRERSRGIAAQQIASTDVSIMRAIKVRRARQIESEIHHIQCQIQQFRSAIGGNPTTYPIARGDYVMSEQSSRPMPVRNSGIHKPEQNDNDSASTRESDQKLPIVELPEGQLACEEVFDQRALAVAGALSPMASLDTVMWPTLHHIPLLFAALIRTRSGQQAVAYRLKSKGKSGRPLMVDYGSRVVCYSSDPQEQRLAVNGMLRIAAERGWASIRWRGNREFLREAIIASERAGRRWTINPESAYIPTEEEVNRWKAEAAKARGAGGARAPNAASPSAEKSEPNARRFKDMPQDKLVERAVHLRRRLGKEFADDGEVEHERPR